MANLREGRLSRDESCSFDSRSRCALFRKLSFESYSRFHNRDERTVSWEALRPRKAGSGLPWDVRGKRCSSGSRMKSELLRLVNPAERSSLSCLSFKNLGGTGSEASGQSGDSRW